MKRPPMLMRVQIGGGVGRFPLWLPLFLLLPLVLVLLIVLSPLILIAIIFLRLSGRGKRMSPVVQASLGALCSLRGIGAAWDMLCSTRGLRADVRDGKERVYVSVI